MQKIQSQTEQVNSSIAKIANASKEQDAGISQITHAVVQMDKAVLSNVGQTEQMAAASNILNEEMEAVQRSIDSLLVLMDGSDSAV